MFKQNPLVKLAPEDLLDHVVHQLQVQGNIRIGEKLRGPSDIVWNGKLVAPKLDLPVVSLKTPIPHVPIPQTAVSVRRFYLQLNQLHNIQLPDWTGARWLYPWSAVIPHAEWMLKHKPGDRVNAMDTEYTTTEYTLTEQDFYDHEFLLFSYALSL